VKYLFLIVAASFPFALLAGCSGSRTTPQAADAKVYDLKGTVISVDRGAKTLRIHHEDIPGKMNAHDMDFAVDDAQLLDGLAAGDVIEARFKEVAGKSVLTQVKKIAGGPTAKEPDAEELAEIKANLAKLSPEDRKIAEEQRLCPDTGEPLGSMGVPTKVVLKGQPVFLCCKGCEKSVQKNPDEILRKVAEFKKKK
jgi:Cu/Ag efflux protein CusF